MLQRDKRYNKQHQKPLPMELQIPLKDVTPKPPKLNPEVSSNDLFHYWYQIFSTGRSDRYGLTRKPATYTVYRDAEQWGYTSNIISGVGWCKAATRFFKRKYHIKATPVSEVMAGIQHQQKLLTHNG